MDMSSAAFMSYVRFDDEHNGGQLSNFRKLLSGEVRAVTGRQFYIFQDTADITLGQDWKGAICAGIDECALFMPIITPSFFNSDACRYELERFAARESELGRNDLILPIYYITCPLLEDNPGEEDDPLVRVIAERNYFDLRDLRGRPRSVRRFSTKLTELAMQVVAGIERNRAMRRRGIFTHAALASSAHGTAGAGGRASAPAKPGLAGNDDQAAADLECWKRIRQFLAAVECMQKDA